MKTKHISKVLALSVLGLFALTGCDEIVAKPTQYEEPLVTLPSSFEEEVVNNIASVVYDSIHESGIGSDVLNEILYLYSVNMFGPYNGNVVINNAKVGDSAITLVQAATDATKIDAFVQAHKAYWDSSRTDASASASESEKKRVEAKYHTIEDRIAEEMYSKISGGTYTDRHIYSEKKLLKSLRGSLESVSNPDVAEEVAEGFYETQILPEVEPEKVFGNYLHRSYYDSDKNTYIVDEVIPTIYRQLMAEQYLLEETYNTLGRSYARQVNIIKFANNENYPNAAYYLAKELVDEINAAPEDYKVGRIAELGLLERFKQYSNASVGVIGALGDEAAILDAAGITKGVINTGDPALNTELEKELGTYYLGTSYGDLAEKYVHMKNVAAYGVSSEYENSFSNTNAYPTYVGLKQQTLALKENDNTTTGWYVKNGGLTELPESIRSRLFNIGVATGVKDSADDKAAAERTYGTDGWKEAEDESAYVCRINGHYYLKTASRVKGDSIENDILHYDADSKSYYIVEIEQAVSASKLSKTSTRNYAHTISEETMQEIINEVSKIVGKGESYSTLATKKYLKAMNIEYHDESVYDYFKTNYPELFDSDAESTSSSEAAAEQLTIHIKGHIRVPFLLS